eukprot:GILI01013358.1.p1 GENE.GILI01013358.1~~GILI01013358.1.p1  ORF type:complete len:148 (-),score=35.41 GILI01013358.1:336-737(-)
MAAIKTCVKYVTTPFVKLGNKLEQTAVSKNASAHLKKEFNSHSAAGTDFAANTASTVWKNRSSIFWYRVERAFVEGRYVASGAYFQGYNYKNAIVDLRFFTRFLVALILGVFVGRCQVFPFVTPGSGYSLEMK